MQVGRSLLQWRYVGRATVVDADQRRRVLGREDVHLALRPYTSGVVVIGVSDPADPHLCWMVSTREPDAWCGAISPSGVTGPAGQPALDSGA